MMKSLLSISFLMLMVLFASCDGRDRMRKTSKEVLQESKLLDSFSENTTYFPESYSETVTDTILSNGTKVSIKAYTDMQNSVLNAFKSDTINFKHYYRDFIADVSITTNNKKNLNYTIDKSFLKKHDTLSKVDNTFYNNAIITSISLAQYDSLSTNKTILIISLCKPETDNCSTYRMLVDQDGELELKPQDL